MSTAMTSPQFIDADAHIFETLEMWDRLPRAFRERVDIRTLTDDPYYKDKFFDVYLDGNPIPTWKGDRSKRVPKLIERIKQKLVPGSGFDPAQVLRDLTIEGLDAVALYPTWCLMGPWIPTLGAEFAGAIARAYNDW